MATLSVNALSKHFGKVKAVDEVGFRVDDGEFLCILGPSGCGKSTVLRMLAGFEEPSAGDIRIDGASVLSLPANRRPTAMVFQKYTLWPHMRVFENIAFGLKLRHLASAEIERKVQESLDMVGMAEYGARFPSQLSGGQQQRVALARALVLEPKILLLDEPFSNLDAAMRAHLREELRRIQRRTAITTVFVTHDQEEALTLADRIAVMKLGHIEQIDRPGEIYGCPRTLFVADFIGAMNLIPGAHRGGTISVGDTLLPAPADAGEACLVTVAIRPEDLAVTDSGLWRGTVEQVVDLGHYRKGSLSIPSLKATPTTIYLPKSSPLAAGDSVCVAPRRYLIYRDGRPPSEMVLAITDGAESTLRAVNEQR